MKITLPWPPSKLSRNGSQGDYRGKARFARQYRSDCLLSTLSQIPPDKRRYESVTNNVTRNAHYIMLEIYYCPPDRRRRDLDNLLSMTKQGIDAIAEVLGVDDSRFEYTLRWGEVCPGGKVEIWV